MGASSTGGVKGMLNNAWQQTGGRVGDAINNRLRGKHGSRIIAGSKLAPEARIPAAPSQEGYHAHLAARAAKNAERVLGQQQRYIDNDQPFSADHRNKAANLQELRGQHEARQRALAWDPKTSNPADFVFMPGADGGAAEAIHKSVYNRIYANIAMDAKLDQTRQNLIQAERDVHQAAVEAHANAMKGVVNTYAQDRAGSVKVDQYGDAYVQTHNGEEVTDRQLANIRRAAEADEAFDASKADLQKQIVIEKHLDKMDAAQQKLDFLVAKKTKLERLFSKLANAVKTIAETRVIAGHSVAEGVANRLCGFFTELAQRFHDESIAVTKQIPQQIRLLKDMEIHLQDLYGVDPTKADTGVDDLPYMRNSRTPVTEGGSRWDPMYLDSYVDGYQEDLESDELVASEYYSRQSSIDADDDDLWELESQINEGGDFDSLDELSTMLDNLVTSKFKS